MTYNKLRKCKLAATICILIAALMRIILFGLIPDAVIYVFMSAGLSIYIGMHILTPILAKKYSLYSDEMSRTNDLKAADFTFLTTSIILVIMLVVTLFKSDDMVISFYLVFSFYMALFVIKDSCYLFLERGTSNYAGTEDED